MGKPARRGSPFTSLRSRRGKRDEAAHLFTRSSPAPDPHPTNTVSRIRPSPRTTALLAATAIALGIGAVALANHRRARRHAARGLPIHKFLHVDGIRLHYIGRGAGPAIVLLHGTGSMAEDFEISGVLQRLAAAHRVIAFDRPGFGHSARPRYRWCTTGYEAGLIRRALHRLGITRAVIVGHSSGAQVAMAMALNAPEETAAVVPIGGYLFPRLRLDMIAGCVLALPLLRDLLSMLVSNVFGWLVLPGYLRFIFAPSPIPPAFEQRFPSAHVLRTAQLRESVGRTLLMNVSAFALSPRYRQLSMPVVAVAGTEDRIVGSDAQSARLQRAVPGCTLRWVPGAGHMAHHIDPDAVTEAIEAAHTAASRDREVAGV